MKRKEKISLLILQIDELIHLTEEWEERYKDKLERVHPKYKNSAKNLVHYCALKSKKLSKIQKYLGDLGLSRLTSAENHIMASLKTTRSILISMMGRKAKFPKGKPTFKKSRSYIRRNAKALLGYRSKGRRTRIMVTLPSSAADDYKLVYNLIANGMNCARINCAHDSAEEWLKMVENIHKASKQIRKKCKIAMDLSGPKIRTGALKKGPGFIKIRPTKDLYGNVLKSAKVYLTKNQATKENLPLIPIKNFKPNSIKNGDILKLKSKIHKNHKIKVIKKYQSGFIAEVPKTTYFETGLKIYSSKDDYFIVDKLPAKDIPIFLNNGDILILKKKQIQGQNMKISEDSGILEPAFVSCSFPEIFDMVKCDESILFDDGEIEGKIQNVSPDEIRILITNVSQKGGKLNADKGINLPQTDLKLASFTKKDKQDLPFVLKYANVVNMSFINYPEDVVRLLGNLNLENLNRKLGIILKIETQSGFNNLLDILLEAMQVYPVGVMIARGDLAIELGWNRIGRVQEEILSLCKAAHITSIWATQVLENLAKRGIPSRAEITDAVRAHRADCVMLNKGPSIIKAMCLIDSILKDMKSTSLALKPAVE